MQPTSDMAKGPRTADDKLQTEGPEVQFYAGVNLIAPNGHAISTLRVLDTKPRQLSDFQRTALRTLSRQVMMQLELRKQIKIEAALKSEMDHRVKNSLQTIASILRIATRRISDPAARRRQITITLKNPQGKDRILVRADDGVGTKRTSETSPRSTRMGELLMASAALQLDGRGENEAGDQGTQPCVQFTS